MAFMASAGDPNYRLMHDDLRFLNECQWQTRWMTFDGGHVMAPLVEYQKAVLWIQSLWK